jgi:hypothetical protein
MNHENLGNRAKALLEILQTVLVEYEARGMSWKRSNSP